MDLRHGRRYATPRCEAFLRDTLLHALDDPREDPRDPEDRLIALGSMLDCPRLVDVPPRRGRGAALLGARAALG